MSDDIMPAQVRELHDVLCEAMVSSDVAQLDGILARDYTLTHMTGYVQHKAEWLEAIRVGEMRYHRMETMEAAPGTDPTAPELTARTFTDATIWGSRATWRLTLHSWFEPKRDSWVITRTVASIW